MSKLFPNRFNVRCNKCKTSLAIGAGLTERQENSVPNLPTKSVFINWCKECCPHRISAPVSQPQVRVLTSDFKIMMPYEKENLPLVKSLPGARWNPADKTWSVSNKPEDRRRILEVADKIGLEVAPSLRKVELSQEAEFAKSCGLYDFQVEGVDWLAKKDRALLGDEMGLGKTAQALFSIPRNGSGLVICRASLIYNWKNECARWRKDLTPVVIRGRGNFRFPKAGELVIINPEILPNDFATRPNKNGNEQLEQYFARLSDWRNEIRSKYPDACNTNLVIDEAHDFKNRKAARTRKVREIGMVAERVTGLTGSPLTNRPDDLYGVLDTLGLSKEVFGSFGRFQELFNAFHNGFAYQYGKPNAIVPELLRRSMIRRLRKDVLQQLPSKFYTNMVVGNDNTKLKARLDEMWSKWEGSLVDVGDLPAFEEFASIRAELAASRIDAMVEYVENCEEQECPLLVFSAHLAPLDALLCRDGWAVISGETKPERRQQIVDDFQAGRLKGVGLTIRAGGVGLTLTHAAKALFVDLDWTPAANWQAEDRICRIGQTKSSVEIIRMVSDHELDLHIQNMLIDKIDTIVKAIDNTVSGQVNPGRSIHDEPKGETEEEYQARMQRLANFEQEQDAKLKEEAKQRAKSKVDGIHRRESAKVKSQPLPLTPERSEQVRRAFKYMLGVCDGAQERDGQGFNKPDASVAHCLLTAGLENQQELEAAQMMLCRYHRQLSASYPLIFRNAA